MKTIKIDEEAYEILALFKVYGQCKSFSQTIKQLKKYLEYKNERIKTLENEKINY